MSLGLDCGTMPRGTDIKTGNGFDSREDQFYFLSTDRSLEQIEPVSFKRFFEALTPYILREFSPEHPLSLLKKALSAVKVVKGYSERFPVYGVEIKGFRLSTEFICEDKREPSPTDLFEFKGVRFSSVDLAYAVDYLLTNTNLAPDDARLDFVTRMAPNLQRPKLRESWKSHMMRFEKEEEDRDQLSLMPAIAVGLTVFGIGIYVGIVTNSVSTVSDWIFLLPMAITAIICGFLVKGLRRIRVMNRATIPAPVEGNYQNVFLLDVIPRGIGLNLSAEEKKDLEGWNGYIVRVLRLYGLRVLAVTTGNDFSLTLVIEDSVSFLNRSEEGLLFPLAYKLQDRMLPDSGLDLQKYITQLLANWSFVFLALLKEQLPQGDIRLALRRRKNFNLKWHQKYIRAFGEPQRMWFENSPVYYANVDVKLDDLIFPAKIGHESLAGL